MNLKIKKRLFKAVMIGLVSSLGLGIMMGIVMPMEISRGL
jgi:hypothetical protein